MEPSEPGRIQTLLVEEESNPRTTFAPVRPDRVPDRRFNVRRYAGVNDVSPYTRSAQEISRPGMEPAVTFGENLGRVFFVYALNRRCLDLSERYATSTDREKPEPENRGLLESI